MRIPVLLTAITLIVFSFLGGNTTVRSSPGSIVAPGAIVLRGFAGKSETKFSSTYSTFTKCGSGMTKKAEKEAEARGSDIPTVCTGPGGYSLHVGYSACSAHFVIEKGEESISLTTQSVGFSQKTMEWRLANGKPFAVIMRHYEYGGDEQCATGGKVINETLIVKGLKGYEHIDETVNVKGTPNPNVKARELADKGYAKSTP